MKDNLQHGNKSLRTICGIGYPCLPHIINQQLDFCRYFGANQSQSIGNNLVPSQDASSSQSQTESRDPTQSSDLSLSQLDELSHINTSTQFAKTGSPSKYKAKVLDALEALDGNPSSQVNL